RKGAPRPLPAEDPLCHLLQCLDPPLAAQGCVRSRHHHDPGQPLLHPGGHRPVTPMLAVDAPWGLIVAIKTAIVLAIIPAGALILGYVFLLKMMSHMQSRLG